MILLEIGANDGVFQSNTTLKDDKEHQVILVEANPSVFHQCKRNRPNATCVNAACTDIDGGSIRFNTGKYSAGGFLDFMGSIEEQTNIIETPQRTIASILKDLNITCIDKMWLDVEGAECHVLKGMKPNTVKWIEVEYHSVESKNFTPKAGRSSFEQIDNECKRLNLTEKFRGEIYGNGQFKIVYVNMECIKS